MVKFCDGIPNSNGTVEYSDKNYKRYMKKGTEVIEKLIAICIINLCT